MKDIAALNDADRRLVIRTAQHAWNAYDDESTCVSVGNELCVYFIPQRPGFFTAVVVHSVSNRPIGSATIEPGDLTY